MENKKECIITLVFIVILATVYHILFIFTLYYFSPTLFIITDLLSPFLTLFFSLIYDNDFKDKAFLKNFVLNLIGYFISLAAAIFYNELIVCNFLGLNENVVDHIKKREQNEQHQALLSRIESSNNSNSSDNEDENEENDANEEGNQEN